ncbi:MAG: membrane protein [Candidatus Kapaibacterium sp.]|nr:MAG: membrane protein [Candidatus Kapabacteria bacterium]
MQRSSWLGLILIAVGTIFLLHAVGILPEPGWIVNWWPLLLIAAGTRIILRKPDNLTGGLLVIALGCLLLADNVIEGFDFWVAAVPVLLIVLGIGIILRPARPKGVHHTVSVAFGGREGTLTDELINATALLGGIHYTVTSQRFRGGSVQTIFGGIELDFRPAQMAAMEASLDVETIFGGVEIIVPSDWSVLVEGTPLFGGIESKVYPRPTTETTPLLRIRATVIFGGISIR